jgi:SAM-dependent methyltransferase
VSPEPHKAEMAGTEEIFASFPSWVSRFWIDGRPFGGERDMSNDRRVLWLDSRFPLRGKRILELGALEGAHAVLLEKLGAAEIVSIEARVDNYVKCCVVKNIFGLHRTRFVLGDLRSLDLAALETFDCCLCLGVLYHLTDPADLLRRIASVAPGALVWTHYADEGYPEGPVESLVSGGIQYRGKYYSEVVSESRAGLQEKSFWPLEEDLHRMIRDAGFSSIEMMHKSVLYGRARCCALYARRT